MSYASVAAHNAPPLSEQPQADPALLEQHHAAVRDALQERTTAEAAEAGKDKVVVVDAEEAAILRASIQEAEAAESINEHFEHAKAETERTLKEAQGTVKSSTKAVENKAQSWEKEAETKGKATLNKVEKKGEELKKEISKDAKKLQKKGAEWEKDARATAKKYPAASSGIVGIANLAVLAAVGVVAYQNWDKPKWDRKTVLLVSVGLLGLFSAEGLLGYYEYEKDAGSK